VGVSLIYFAYKLPVISYQWSVVTVPCSLFSVACFNILNIFQELLTSYEESRSTNSIID
jgi:hypothetical protein